MEVYAFKLFATILAILLMVTAYVPYLRDLFKGNTQPHTYTWLIWAITASVATAGVYVGGGDLGFFPMLAGTSMVIFVLILSLKYGSKNITTSDTLTLITALLAIVIWVQLENPLLAVMLVTIIDGLGYIPTFRKVYQEPMSETRLFWFLITVSYLFNILASAEFNLLTALYLTTIGGINICLYTFITLRRKNIARI